MNRILRGGFNPPFLNLSFIAYFSTCMDTAEQYIKNLREKIQLLARHQRQLQKENQQLKEDVEVFKEQTNAIKQEMSVLEMQNAMLKASQQHLTDKEKKEMEKKLQHFIGEIDRCISMLSR
ncbi:MAG: hypothetical protein HEQ40_17655 [Lacibacter sp.]